ncbi:MAG: hypothetical protein QW279_16295, partial [Candidatus Jordarchaeaceae archaeon]
MRMPMYSYKTLLIKASLAYIVVLIVFIAFYTFFSYSGLPLGWDTPRYVWHMQYLADSPTKFIEDNGFYNILYALCGAFIVKLGVNAMVVEILLPHLLVYVFILQIIRGLILIDGNSNFPTRFLLALGWFAVFRFGADLHANLLGLILILEALFNLIKYFRNQTMHSLVASIFLFLLASFAHIETTIYFIILCILGITISNGLKSAVKTGIFLAVAVTPAFLLYFYHLYEVAYNSGGFTALSSPMPFWVWLAYIGPLGIFGFRGLYYATKSVKNPDFLYTITIIWGCVSLLVPLIQYMFPSLFFVTFGERALMLFPAPFLAQIAISKTQNSIPVVRIPKKIKTTTLVLVLSAAITIAYATYFTYRVFLPNSIYDKLIWIKENYRGEKIILLVDDYDEFAGIKADLYNNWIKAIIDKDAYTYLGDSQYLTQNMSTPYFNTISTQISNTFFNLINKKITCLQDLKILYVAELNVPAAPPNWFLTATKEVYNGIYEIDREILSQNTERLLISFYKGKLVKGNFFLIEKNWSLSASVLEFYDTNTQYGEYLLKFKLRDAGKYNMSLRYLANQRDRFSEDAPQIISLKEREV